LFPESIVQISDTPQQNLLGKSTVPAQAECRDCGHLEVYTPSLTTCPNCQGDWFQAKYDYDSIALTPASLLKQRNFDLWRYLDLLPISKVDNSLAMGEGGTPLLHAYKFGMMLGLPNLFIKDERRGPTHSFKDRQAAVNIAALKEAGVTEMVLASTGNVAIAYSAFAARAGIKCWAFLTSLVPAEKMREVAIYGTQVVKVTATYDQAKKLAAQFARQRGLYLEKGARSIPSVEAMKTIAYEIAEQLTDLQTQEPSQARPYTTPDWYIQAISGGMGPLGVQKGFEEFHRMGWIQKMPAIAGVQTEGCAPMVHAWKKDQDTIEPVVSPKTHIATLSTGDPGRAYTLLRRGMMATGRGTFESVADEESFRTMHTLAKLEGISVEPAAAVAFAGLIKLVHAGVIKPEETVVVNCSGHTMPVERSIMGNGWSRNVSVPSQIKTETPQEGLLAALNRVTADRFHNILIVDDTEQARRLIHRILQAQGKYNLLEASNGLQAIEMAQSKLPDLIILDLMMPEIDGFGVLDALKANPQTAAIPVIVVTAKELTLEEKKRLKGQIQALMQKGEFLTDDLVEEVRSIIQ
jgi:threonine synthase